jgi:predicted amidohydrolase
VQFQPELAVVDPNLKRMETLVLSAPKADLLVLPELASCGYDFLDSEELATVAEPFGKGPTSQAAHRWAKSTGSVIVVGYAEQAEDSVYNSSLLATPDGDLHNYRKIHLFYREKELFAPGDTPPNVIETSAGRIGMMICFDWTFPETARLIALAGGQIIAHPSNLVMPWCQRAMFARCLENSVFAITANRIGTEARADRSLTFTGQSQITGPRGETLASAPEQEEEVTVVNIDLADADDKAYNPMNHRFKDRRTELYGNLL